MLAEERRAPRPSGRRAGRYAASLHGRLNEQDTNVGSFRVVEAFCDAAEFLMDW